MTTKHLRRLRIFATPAKTTSSNESTNHSEAMENERHKLIVQRSKSLLQITHGKDADSIRDILQRSQAHIDNYNRQNRTAIDVSKVEDGLFRGNVKKLILGKYTTRFTDRKRNPYNELDCNCEDECDECKIKIEQYWINHKEKEAIAKEFLSACDSTVFSADLRDKYVMFLRNKQPHQPLSPLLLALRDVLHTEIITVFQNQNQQLIKKHAP